MTVPSSPRRDGGGDVERPRPSGLEVILDKGLVIDACVRVSLVGIERFLTVDARLVIASGDTDVRFAEVTARVDLFEQGGRDITETIDHLRESGATTKTSGAIQGGKQELPSGGSDDEERSRRPTKEYSSRRRGEPAE